jgi:phosphate-selective porin OprO and OprP
MKKDAVVLRMVIFKVFLLAASNLALAQATAQPEPSGSEKQAKPAKDPALEKTIEADTDSPPADKTTLKWNKYDFKYFTLNWGIYFIFDYGTAIQNEESKQQFTVESTWIPRDFRFVINGKFKTKRPITYTTGIMYDGPTKTWFPREAGIQIEFPELLGNLWLGRQKEGFSQSKIAVGYALYGMERMPSNDAMIPIFADGLKWLGYLPSGRANWNVSYFHNFLDKSPATGWFDDSFVARFVYLPMLPESEGGLLHLGAAYRWAKVADGELQLRSRPESYTAPYFLDTGTFPADHNNMVGLEAYYRPGSWLFGSEYFFNKASSPSTGDPFFHGGEVYAAWLITGEVRPYNTVGGKFGYVVPNKSALFGGPGAVEAALHLSYTDFDSGSLQGGKFWRLTPHINWYLDNMLRFEFCYGLGVLDRFGLTGVTHFFQLRMQFQIV